MITWLIITGVSALVVGGTMILIPRLSRNARRQVRAQSPYTDHHAAALQRRAGAINDLSATHRASLTQILEKFDDELSAETRATKVMRDAEDLDRIAENRKRMEGRTWPT